jgi:Tol biopolymer transport system component
MFDLLGDLYRMPIAGGKASPLRVGVPFDTQARYSPDGKSFIFRSDEVGGLDNVYLASFSDPYNARLITNESFRFVSNAQWSPLGDDKFVAVKVRKGESILLAFFLFFLS